jgi:purine-binding chemotaxis protein CheW
MDPKDAMNPRENLSTAPVSDPEFLLFDVGGYRYGLPAMQVHEIVPAVPIIPLPKAPAIVEGIINLRGKVVPVLDIRQRFRLPAKPLAHTDHLVVANAAGRLVALRVDAATELRNVSATEIDDVRNSVPGAEYLSLVARLDESLVLIHDIETFLSRMEIDELEETLAGPRESASAE